MPNMDRDDFDRKMVEAQVEGLELTVEKYRGLLEIASKVGATRLAAINADLLRSAEDALRRTRDLLTAPGAN